MPVVSRERTAPAAEAEARDVALARWRLQARVLAVAAMLALPQLLGVTPLPLVLVAIFISIRPEPSGALALGLMSAWAFVVRATGQIHFGLEPWMPGRAAGAGAALVVAAASFWLLGRRRTSEPEAPTRGPLVLGILLAIATAPAMLFVARGARHDQTPLDVHQSLEVFAEMGPSLLALGAVWLHARRRWVRLASVGPFALVLVGLVGASDWRLERFVLADVPPTGASISWGAPRPAVVLGARQLAKAGFSPAISPGGKAFSLKLETAVQVGDFGDRLVELEARAAAFLDDERLLVVRAAGVGAGEVLAEVRPFASPAAVWTKELPRAAAGVTSLAFDREGGTVFVQQWDAHGERRVYRTTADGAAPLVRVPVAAAGAEDDPRSSFLSQYFSVSGAGELFLRPGPQDPVARGAADLLLATPEALTALPGSLGRLRCVSSAGDAVVWCVPMGVTSNQILLRVDARNRVLERVPGRLGFSSDLGALDRRHLVIARAGELRVIDVETRRGERLTLPPGEPSWNFELAAGGLAVFKHGQNSIPSTLTLYAR
jgi:hypothetical protein